MAETARTPTEKEIRNFLEVWGTRGEAVMSILQKNLPEINELVKSDIGWELVKHDVKRCLALIEKIIEGKITEDEKAEVKYLYFTRIPHVVKKITMWLEAMNAIINAPKRESNG